MSIQKSTSTLLEAHNEWATRPNDQRFESLEALKAAVHGRRVRSRSAVVPVNDINCILTNDGQGIAFNRKLTPIEPTHWSFGQFSQMVGAPASYLRTLPKPMVVDLFNHGINATPRGSMKFLTIEEENRDTNTLQAVTSESYGRIWDADVVDCASRIIEQTGNVFRNPYAYGHRGTPNGFKTLDMQVKVPSGLYASDRDVFMFFIDGGDIMDLGERAKLHRGFFMWNSEVGDKTFGLQTFLFNTVCGNNMVWGAQDINRLTIRHSKGGPSRFDRDAAPTLMSYIQSSDSAFRSRITLAQEKLLPAATGNLTMEDIITVANKAARFTRKEISAAVEMATLEEGECKTYWQLVQGMTAYARGYDYADTRIDLETRAGKILDLLA